MGRSISNDNSADMSPSSQRHHMIDSNTLAFMNEPRQNATVSSDFNDLSSSSQQQQQQALTPKTILRSQQQAPNGGNSKTVKIHSQPEIIQLQSGTSSLRALSNPCYFASLNDAMSQYDIEQHIDNTVVISIRDAQNSTNNNNNNN